MVSLKPSQTTAVDAIWAAVAECALILAVGGIGLAVHRALLFTSLGPTAFEQAEKPESKTARPYNIVVGHLVAMGTGFAALAILGTWDAPKVEVTHHLTWARVATAVVALSLTVFINRVIHANQPAACSTVLLVSLGAFQTGHDALLIVYGVLAIAIIGEPARRFRLRVVQPAIEQLK